MRDIIIIGGGVAGACAAMRLAKQGLRVLLLEKQTLPRYKPCGGGVIARAHDDFPMPITPAIQTVFHSARMNCVDAGLSFSITRDRPILYMTQREDLDFMLVEGAKASGAEILEHCAALQADQDEERIALATSQGEFKARYLIAADGAAGSFTRDTGLRAKRPAIPAVEYEITVDSKTFDRLRVAPRFDFGVVHGGYAWMFPKRSHISIGVLSTRPRGVNLRRAFHRYLDILGVVEWKELRGQGHIIPFGPPPSRFGHRRILFAGDAAGLADPVTLEGISFALGSAKAAADALTDEFQNPQRMMDQYESALRKNIVPEIRAGNLLAGVLYKSNRIRNFLFRHYGKALCEAMSDIMIGERNYNGEIKKAGNVARLFGRLNPFGR